MQLIFIRHGQPQWDIDGHGVDDPVLTPIGELQARHTANAMLGCGIDRIIVSPLIRAQQTAAPIVEALGIEPETRSWLAEISAPVWQGTPSEVIERAFAEQRARPLDEQWEAIPGGESFREFHTRVTDGVAELLDELGCHRISEFPPLWHLDDEGPRIAIVAHTGTNAVAMGQLLGIPPVPWEWERFVAFHASVSIVQPMRIANAHSFSLFRHSDLSHLPDELQTR